MNFKHLHYFWRVAKAGGIACASEMGREPGHKHHAHGRAIPGEAGVIRGKVAPSRSGPDHNERQEKHQPRPALA